MLKFFTRRRAAATESDGSLAIGDLLDQPALRAVMQPVDADEPISLDWARLIAAGPMRFDTRPLAGRAA